jgi:HEAT repeat protein
MKEITVFISSPGDVAEERKECLQVIQQYNGRTRVGARFRLTALAYEGAVPAIVGESAQSVVNRYMRQAGKCDIFVCVLWSRMGTPVLDDETGDIFDSGTLYEFMQAYNTSRSSHDHRPRALLYQCNRSFPNDVDLEQVRKVRDFFGRFLGPKKDLDGLIKTFTATTDFSKMLFDDIDTVLSQDFTPSEPDESQGPSALVPEAEQATRRRYLETLSNDVQNRLEKSIHARLDINSTESLDTTTLPWEYQAKDVEQQFSSIQDVFAAFKGRLLLLGGPGSGKTTTLLSIAQRLLADAKADPRAPIPLLFNLSKFTTFARQHERRLPSLVDKRRDNVKADPTIVEDWLTTLLAEYPGMATNTARTWIQQDKVAVLLDGLDEVDEVWLERLALSLNESYLQRHPETIVVVCSRIVDYAPLKRQYETQLNLRGAVILKPLDRAQIDAYLEARDATGLKDALAGDAVLEELAQVPLTLSMMVHAYGGLPAAKIPSNLPLTEQRRHLFDTYIDRMMQREARRRHDIPFDLRPERDQPTPYSRAEINRNLGWLAVRLSERMQTVFPPRRIYDFMANRQTSVILPQGIFLAVCAAIIGATLESVSNWGWKPVALVAAVAIAPALFSEQTTNLTRYFKWGMAGILWIVVLFGGFGLVSASVHDLFARTTSIYLMALTVLVVTTIIFASAIFIDEKSYRFLLRYLLITIAVPLLTVFFWGAVTPRTAAWLGIGAAALAQVVSFSILARSLEDGRTLGLIIPGIGLIAVGAAIAAAWMIGAPTAMKATAILPAFVVLVSADSFDPAVIAQIVLGSVVGGMLGRAPGAVMGCLIATVISIKWTLPGLGSFCRRKILDPVLRVQLVLSRSVPWKFPIMLRYAVDTLLLKDVGSEFEFVHRLLRDHFATRELTPRLKAASLAEQLRTIESLSRQGEAAVEPLGTLLNHPLSELRASAAAGLARIGTPSVEQYLDAASVDPSPEVRRALASSISKGSDEMTRRILAAGVSDADESVRTAAIRSLNQFSNYDRRRILEAALVVGSSELHRQILRLLPRDSYLPATVFDRRYYDSKTGGGYPGLLAYLEDPDPDVRWSTILVCAGGCNAASKSVITKTLFDSDLSVRSAFLDQLQSQTIIPHIAELLQLHQNPGKGARTFRCRYPAWIGTMRACPRIKAAVTRLLAETEEASTLHVVKQSARDRHVVVRKQVAEVFGHVSAPGRDALLLELLSDRSPVVSEAAARSIGGLRVESSGPALMKKLRSGVPEVRSAVAFALGKIQCEGALSGLIHLLYDDADFVQTAAIDALGEFRDPVATQALREKLRKIRLARHPHQETKYLHLADALSAQNAVEALPDFEALLATLDDSYWKGRIEGAIVRLKILSQETNGMNPRNGGGSDEG